MLFYIQKYAEKVDFRKWAGNALKKDIAKQFHGIPIVQCFLSKQGSLRIRTFKEYVNRLTFHMDKDLIDSFKNGGRI